MISTEGITDASYLCQVPYMPRRAKKAFMLLNVQTVGELRAMGTREMRTVDNVGAGTERQVRCWLESIPFTPVDPMTLHGGPAFPSGDGPNHLFNHVPGMTVRALFAKDAMGALISRFKLDGVNGWPNMNYEELATRAVSIADALLKELRSR